MNFDQAVEDALVGRQAESIERIRQVVEAAEIKGTGRVIFITGPAGSGKSHLLRGVARALRQESPHVRLVASHLGDDQIGAGSSPAGGWGGAQLLSSVAALASDLAGFAIPAVSPGLQILTQTIEASRAAGALFSQLQEEGQRGGLTDLIEPILAAAAREEQGNPLICLIDESNLLNGAWWLSLQFSLAGAIARDLPLVLVLSIDVSEDASGSQSSAQEIAASLVDRGVADYFSLEPLTAVEVSDWMGPMSESLANALVEATGGYPGDLLDLWRDVRAQEQIERRSNGWTLTRGAVIGLDYGVRGLAKRISIALGQMSPARTELVRRALAAAALEGRTFTAEAVAATCGREKDEIIDLLDALVEGLPAEDAVLREAHPAVIENATRSQSRHLWRYRFTRTLDWRVARQRLGDDAEGDAVRRDFANHLVALYEPEVFWVAHVVASLLGQAGDEDEARQFDHIAFLRVSEAVLATLARQFMASDTAGWGEREFHNAADVLLHSCWELQGSLSVPEVIAYADRAKEWASRSGPGGRLILARTLCVLGRFEFQAGNPLVARACLEKAIQMSRYETPAALGESLRQLGSLMWQLGNLGEARSVLEEALEVFRRQGISAAQGACLSEIAEIDRYERKFDSALERNAEALACARAAGLPVNEAAELHQRAGIALDCGEPEAARVLMLRVLPFQREHRRRADEAACLRTLGVAELALGRVDIARNNVIQALAIEREVGKRIGEGVSLTQLGEIDFLAGNKSQAKTSFEQAEVLFREDEDDVRAAECRSWLDRLA